MKWYDSRLSQILMTKTKPSMIEACSSSVAKLGGRMLWWMAQVPSTTWGDKCIHEIEIEIKFKTKSSDEVLKGKRCIAKSIIG